MAKQRILLKLSGEYLGGVKGVSFDNETVQALCIELITLAQNQYEIGIVIGGGNFFRGGSAESLERSKADQIGMLATCMNSLYLEQILLSMNQKVYCSCAIEMPRIMPLFDKRSALEALQQGKIAIFAGGTNNPFFSTDTAATLRALEIEANLLIKATKVNGVYTKDPMKHKDAVLIKSMSFDEMLQKDLKAMDATAIALCRENNLPIGVVNIATKGAVLQFLQSKTNGTFIHT